MKEELSMKGKCFCGSGKKHKKCHSTIESNSKLANLIVASKEYDKVVKDNDYGAKCPRGCSFCCSDFFFVDENDFLLIVDYIQRKLGKLELDNYIQKAKDYERVIEKEYPNIQSELNEFMPDGGDLIRYSDDNFINWKNSLNCMFLENGKCSIYEVRPDICRMFGVNQKCDKATNEISHFIEEQSLLQNTSFVIHRDGRVIKQRGYPLYYYFSYFMGNQLYKELTLKKVKAIRTKNESEYFEFKMGLRKK